MSIFPRSTADWQLSRAGKIHTVDESKVRKVAGRWFLTQQTLISTPQSNYLLPAICAYSIAEFTHDSFLRRYRFILYLLASYLFVTITLAAISENSQSFYRVILFILISLAYFSFEYWLSLKPYNSIVERTLFLHWSFQERNFPLWCFFTLIVLSGMVQLVMHLTGSQLDSLVMSYGTYFPAISAGEWWRYFTGPLIHASFLHWFVNVFFLFFLIRITGRIAKNSLVVLLACSLPVSAIAVHIFATGHALDGFVGVSGAVYFMFGWLTGVARREQFFFPSHFSTSVLLLATINLLIPELLGFNSSLIAHVAGLCFGLVAGIQGWNSNIMELQHPEPSRNT